MASTRIRKSLFLAALAAAATAGQGAAYGGVKLTSSAFANGKPIPLKHAYGNANLSPPLAWTGVPAGTKSLALIVTDSSAANFTHWVIYNIPPTTKSLPRGVSYAASPGAGISQGKNDFGATGWGGPWPPPGENHKYVFRIYAVSAKLSGGLTTRAAVLSAMNGKILAQGTLTGTFKRN